MEKLETFTVAEGTARLRLDAYLSAHLSDLSRSAVKTLIEQGLVSVNGESAKPSRRVKTGEFIRVTVPEKSPPASAPEDIPLDILYEDADVIVVNKPQGLTVHPGAGRASGTLVNALLFHTDALSDAGGPLRPGIVHRLDKDTSGVMAIARTNRAHMRLSAQFKKHSTARRYTALVWGQVRAESGSINLALGRDRSDRKKISARSSKKRHAFTAYRVLRRYPGFTLLELTPKTGRTHQLRVHLASIGHPIAGDPVYGKRTPPSSLSPGVRDALNGLNGQFLHAAVLGFDHPVTGKRMEFSSEPPKSMKTLLNALERTVKCR